MQELTVAYQQNDLHTLLRLEMQWIENESGDIERLTEERLAMYNEVLREQVKGLENRLHGLLFHPRYRPIVVLQRWAYSGNQRFGQGGRIGSQHCRDGVLRVSDGRRQDG
jgi:hypothetical protein